MDKQQSEFFYLLKFPVKLFSKVFNLRPMNLISQLRIRIPRREVQRLKYP
jgi:hypothetical protein